MSKFGRKFRLTIDRNDGNGQIVITNPFTIQFVIERSANASLNEFQITIYNLSLQTRNLIRQDEFFAGSKNKVKLEAGYDQLFTIFQGFIIWAYNGREHEDVTTTIFAQDGGNDVRNTQFSQTFAAGTSVAQIFQSIIGAFPNLSVGAIGDYGTVFNKSVTVDDNAWNAIKNLAAAQPFIDKGQIFCLQNNEYLDMKGGQVFAGVVPIISAETGLLETPRRRNAYIDVTSMFEPRITVGQLAQIQSQIEPNYNGQYKVMGVNHSGVISDAIGGQLVSKFALLSQPSALITKAVPVAPAISTVPAKA